LNIAVITNQLKELKQHERSVFAYDGREALDKATSIIKQAIQEAEPEAELI
jgi:hypothetical protein